MSWLSWNKKKKHTTSSWGYTTPTKPENTTPFTSPTQELLTEVRKTTETPFSSSSTSKASRSLSFDPSPVPPRSQIEHKSASSISVAAATGAAFVGSYGAYKMYKKCCKSSCSTSESCYTTTA